MNEERPVQTIEHAGLLEDLAEVPAFLLPPSGEKPGRTPYSCSFCGVGDSGVIAPTSQETDERALPLAGQATLRLTQEGRTFEVPAVLEPNGQIEVPTSTPLTAGGVGEGMLSGELLIASRTVPFTARETERKHDDRGNLLAQRFTLYQRTVQLTELNVTSTVPTAGCIKLKLSMMRQRPAFPIHSEPSVLDTRNGKRRPISYQEAISRFADLMLKYRQPQAKTLFYGSGQVDYFTVFAVQEVFRLLGVRNLTGNAEHCLNSGAKHVELLTGQETPLLTIQQGIEGPNRFYLFNGWNGFVGHPPVFRAILKREDLDAYLIEVAVTESAKELAKRLDPERILLIRPRGDAHLALAVAHEILTRHPQAVEQRFVNHFADTDTFNRLAELARSSRFDPERVAERIAPEPGYAERILKGIRMIALKLIRPDSVPINISSMGLSQTNGVVAHAIWGGVLAMLGKFGLRPDGSPAGGTLRLAGQINAESEAQGLSRNYFMGRVLVKDSSVEAARRMGLPDDAYAPVLKDGPRAALDYSDPTPDTPELIVCMGTQFESNMMERVRWHRKLCDPGTCLVVIDPIPDPFTVEHAELIIPSPPHPATAKVYQNGEWKMSLSVPNKRAASETRTDATIVYDTMAEITRRLADDPALAQAHPDLARHAQSGYLSGRFLEPGLPRIDNEVSRSHLWERIQAYMSGGCGPLYCRPEHPDGRPIQWTELLQQGSIIYGGIGTTRNRLDYDRPDQLPFGDIYRQPRRFTFFVPTEDDLRLPQGIIFNSGRSSLSDEPKRIRFAISSFNSGKATPIVEMPEENPVYVSLVLAGRLGLKTGDYARVTGRYSGGSLVLPVVVSDRVKGESIYVSFHKCRAQIEHGQHINNVTSREGRCPYSGQTNMKMTQVLLVKARGPAPADGSDAHGQQRETIPAIVAGRLDTTRMDAELPVWSGQNTPLYVTDVIPQTHDAATFRFQGDPLCRFVYKPGQFCSLVLNIEGKKVVRSYTISSSPTRPYSLEITVKRVPGGVVSNWLHENLRVGDRIEVSGPKGKFCLVPGKIPPKILLVGAGSGVTPALSMGHWLCDVSANVDVKFLNVVRTPNDIICEKEIELMALRNKQLTPIHVASRGGDGNWTGLTGRVSRAMLEKAIPDIYERHIYMCGPQPFMDAVRDILAEMKFDLANLHTESFGGVRTSVADKPMPLSDGGSVAEQARDTVGSLSIEFARSGKVASTDGRLSLLDLAEANDVELPYGCRTGNCGDCKTRLLKGEVAMSVEEGLSAAEKADGFILTCVGRPRTACTLDA